MASEHQWSSHYQENGRLPERRGTYLSEFLILHALQRHIPSRNIIDACWAFLVGKFVISLKGMYAEYKIFHVTFISSYTTYILSSNVLLCTVNLSHIESGSKLLFKVLGFCRRQIICHFVER